VQLLPCEEATWTTRCLCARRGNHRHINQIELFGGPVISYAAAGLCLW
jgi:hypothetical protein